MWPFKKSKNPAEPTQEEIRQQAQQAMAEARQAQGRSAAVQAAQQRVAQSQRPAANTTAQRGESDSVMAPPAAPPPPPALPPGWKTAKDPNTGRDYFFNKKLGITQWERPEPETAGVESIMPPPKAPPQAKEAAVKPASADQRQDSGLSDQYTLVIEELEEHSVALMKRVRHFYATGDKLAAVPLYTEKKYVQSLITWLGDRKAKGLALPSYKVLQRRVVCPDVNSEVPKDKLLVSVVGCSGVESDLPLSCKVSLAWPRDTPQEKSVAVGKGKSGGEGEGESNEALFDVSPSSSAFQRQVDRRHVKLTFQVCAEDKGWLSTKTILIGKAQLEVFPLLSSSSSGPSSLPLSSDKVRGKAVGEVTVKMASNKPWAGGKEKMKVALEKVIVVQDELAPAPPQALQQELQRFLSGA
eukprot:CAMPEP_0181330698 /NCGR_PEP_ID=MMETSP1101-20121128/24061_1 /TAXON_ID=46948 /ORGANISM="Rhodomonas abbreviata, Strain Caron Lab Isolate" /LENGTH=411 /DNA_ID=CAMNT_0023440017 /DNA_START=118 /DNA_END=1350 /DNA_ORIENTATION=-